MWKMSSPSSIRHSDSNSRPLNHESSPITTWPGLPVKMFYFKFIMLVLSMGQSRAFLIIFVLFTSELDYKLKNCRFYALDLNPGPQDGRHWHIYWAMAASLKIFFVIKNLSFNFFVPRKGSEYPVLTSITVRRLSNLFSSEFIPPK